MIIPRPSPLMKEICNHIHQPIKRCLSDFQSDTQGPSLRKLGCPAARLSFCRPSDWSYRFDFFEVREKVDKRLAVDLELFQSGVTIREHLIFLGVVLIAESYMVGC